VRRTRLATCACAALLLGLAAALGPGCGAGGPSVPLLRARRGDLEVLLELQGTLRPVNQQSIKAPRWGEIRRMAPNGSQVTAGQIVLELDSEDTENAIHEHRADVAVANAELRQVEKEIEKSRRQAQLRRAATRLARELAESRLKELQARPTERELIDARGKVQLAQALVQAGTDSLELIRELVEKGYAAGTELRSAELELAQAKADLAASRSRLATVQAGPPTSELKEASIRLQQARLAEQSAENNLLIVKEWTEAKLARFTRRLERENEKLAEAERRLSEYQAAAPNNGVVLYAPRRWGGQWQPGQRVWQGATIMSIPEMSRMKVIIQVPASSVRTLESLGEVAARVRVPALPERVFSARLTKMGSIGRDEFDQLDSSTAGKLGRAERQVFEAEVELQEEDARLKPGFTAEAELILQSTRDAVIVPRMALLQRTAGGRGRRRGLRAGSRGSRERSGADQALVYVRSESGFEPHEVEVICRTRFEAAVRGPVRENDVLYPGRPPGAKLPPPPEPTGEAAEDSERAARPRGRREGAGR
jgi:HlyD family secretion protein